MNREQLVDEALAEVRAELLRAIEKFRPMNSPHEGYAVILEELDELWDEVKKQPYETVEENVRKEATQVAAMAVRFMLDCAPKPTHITFTPEARP